MTYLREIKKHIKTILLQSGDPISLPEIQVSLRKFNIEVNEVDILKAINNMPAGEYELIPAPVNKTKSDPQERSTKYQSGIYLKRKHRAKIRILNSLSNISEMHISTIEDLFAIKEEKVCLHEILEEMKAEGLIRFSTTDHHFITLTSAGKDYLDIFQ